MEASSSFCYRNLCFASSSSCTSSWDPFPGSVAEDTKTSVAAVASTGTEAGTEGGLEDSTGPLPEVPQSYL